MIIIFYKYFQKSQYFSVVGQKTEVSHDKTYKIFFKNGESVYIDVLKKPN